MTVLVTKLSPSAKLAVVALVLGALTSTSPHHSQIFLMKFLVKWGVAEAAGAIVKEALISDII
jgi:hypothetical protein